MKLKNIFNCLLIGAVLFGSVAGAGFASGKEIWYYFAQFGWICYPIIIFAGIIFVLLSYLFLQFGKRFAINTVQDMNKVMFGKFSIVAEVIFVLSNLILLSAMFAGSGSLFDIILPQSSYRFASIITAIIVLVISWLGFEKMMKVNFAVVPMMVGVIVGAFVYCFVGDLSLFIPQVSGAGNTVHAIFFCLLFICSNMFFAGFIFAKLGKDFTRGENIGGCIVGALFMVLCLLGMVTTIYLNPYSSMSDMPLVYIATSVSKGFAIMALITIWIGIATTAISLIYTIGNWLKLYMHNSFILASTVACIVALIISGLGFSTIVNYCYPVLGGFGVVFVVVACIKTFPRKKRPKAVKLKKKEGKV